MHSTQTLKALKNEKKSLLEKQDYIPARSMRTRNLLEKMCNG
jgi:hypothetical protein